MDWLILAFLGLGSGIISSFFGIGGAALIVPVLYGFFPQLTASTIIGTSLGVILLSAIYNSLLFFKAGIRYEYRIFVPLIPTIIIGALLGSNLTQVLSEMWLKRIFAIALIIVTLKILFFKIPPSDQGHLRLPKKRVGLAIGLLVGLIAGLTGLGGGTVLTPTFLALYKMPPKRVPAYNNLLMTVATSAALMHFIILPAPENSQLFPLWQWGQSNWALILIIFLGSMLSAPLGVKWNHKVSEELKKNLFAALMFILSLQMILKTV